MKKEELIEKLKEILKENDTVYTILRHVSKSGMSRDISVIIIKDNSPLNITYHVSEILNLHIKNNGVRVYGVGMDMGFNLVYNLSYVLFKDGYKLRHKWI